MTFENLVTFCNQFGLFPETITRQNLLSLYQSFLHNNYDESTFDVGSLILLLGIVSLQNDIQEYTPSQKLLILIEKMSSCQSRIDKKANAQMKNNAYFSLNRPKDFISVFGPHVLQEFPHVKPKAAQGVPAKPKIVIQRVCQQNPDLTLQDIFYRVDHDVGDKLRINKAVKVVDEEGAVDCEY